MQAATNEDAKMIDLVEDVEDNAGGVEMPTSHTSFSVSNDPDMTPAEIIAARQKKHLNKRIQVWNKSTGDKYLGGFFMLIGTVCVVALGACVVGSLRQQAQAFLISTDRLYQRNGVMLAGYSSWDDMHSNCCCLKGGHPSESFIEQERWVCLNQKVIERGRKTRDGKDNALPMRSLCNITTTYPDLCTIDTDGVGKPYMNCGESYNAFVPDVLSAFAFTYLF